MTNFYRNMTDQQLADGLATAITVEGNHHGYEAEIARRGKTMPTPRQIQQADPVFGWAFQ